jgi:PAS domain-containing protein
MPDLRNLIHEAEEEILERVMREASERGFAKHMPATEEGYRRSVHNLVDALDETIEAWGEVPVLRADTEDAGDTHPAVRAGEDAFTQHHARGIEPGLVYGAIAMYRTAFEATVYYADLEPPRRLSMLIEVTRFFDAVLYGFVRSISRASVEGLAGAAVERNRTLVSEKNRYVRAFEYLPMPLFFIDRQGLVETMNASAAALFAPPERERAGRFRSDAVHKAPPVLALEIADFVSGPDRERSFERELKTGKGSRHFEVRLAKLFDTEGASVGMVAILSDLTYRHHSEEALRESQARYRALVQNMSVPWAHVRVIIDAQNRAVDFEFLEVNQAYEEATGRDSGQMVGKRMREIGPPLLSDVDSLLPMFAHVARTGESAVIDHAVTSSGATMTFVLYCPQPGHVAVLMTSVTAGSSRKSLG